GRELGEKLLVIGVVGLDDGTLAGVLEALDRLRRDVVVPVVEVEFVLGERRERGEQQRERERRQQRAPRDGKCLRHDANSSCERSSVGEIFDAMMISASVSSINRLETAFTSGVTAILIIE